METNACLTHPQQLTRLPLLQDWEEVTVCLKGSIPSPPSARSPLDRLSSERWSLAHLHVGTPHSFFLSVKSVPVARCLYSSATFSDRMSYRLISHNIQEVTSPSTEHSWGLVCLYLGTRNYHLLFLNLRVSLFSHLKA